MLREFWASLKAAIRSFRRRPAFFAVSTVTLGIALGFATTILGVVEKFERPAMPFDEPDRTFEVHFWGGGDPVHPGPERGEIVSAIEQIPAFSALTRAKPRFGDAPSVFVGDRPVFQRGEGGVAAVPSNFFRVIGVRPRLGRTFTDDEGSRGNSAIVSDDIWKAFFADRAAIGKAEITVAGQVYSIVGVMPAGMNEPATFTIGAWLPLVPGDSGQGWFPDVRLRAGATRAAAEAQLAALAARLNAQYPTSKPRKYGLDLHPLRREGRSLGGFYFALIGIVLCILTIASANITTLMLARAIARRRDLALRLSLGAGSRTLVLDQLAESTVLAFSAGIAGMMFALWGIGTVTHFVGGEVGWLTTLAPTWSWRFFATSLGAAAVVALLVGSLPALQVGRIQPMEPLKESSGGTTGRGARRVQVLVAVELAVSLSLLMATALFARSTLRLADFQFGFNASHVLSVDGDLVYKWNAEKLGTENPVSIMLPRVEAMEGVESASTLATGHPERSQVFSDRTAGIAPLLVEDYLIAGPHFMRTMGIPLVAGRDFQPGDEVRGAVILDERAVKSLFSDGAAIGHAVRLGSDDGAAPWLEVIGVSRKADLSLPKYLSDGPRWPPIYASKGEHNTRRWQVVARVSGNAPAASVRIARALNALLPGGIAEAGVRPFSSDFDARMRLALSLMRVFLSVGVASLALATAGLFAVMSYMVNQRMREFAVRVAIGARSGHLWKLVLRDAAQMALAGTALGAFGGFFAGSFFGGALYGVGSTDVVSLIVAEVVLLSVSLGVCIIPALRATRADPVEILRAS
ncbi:MAG TPA: ABC transporter permease [Gemmatimonadaceae bacterium]|jgi:predicted permease|nr:ABC transporter permease [Gemmatimonadaceae bacterium]